MAINFFQVVEDSTADIPFIEDFVKATPHCEQYVYEVIEVRLTKKRTGYLLKTNQFLVFLFKNKDICKQLIAGLEMYQKDGNGYGLFVKPMLSSPYFQLGFDPDEPRTWMLESEGKYLSLGINSIASFQESIVENTLTVPLPPTQTVSGKKRTTHPTSKNSTSGV